jgi:hypothetical protein
MFLADCREIRDCSDHSTRDWLGSTSPPCRLLILLYVQVQQFNSEWAKRLAPPPCKTARTTEQLL